MCSRSPIHFFPQFKDKSCVKIFCEKKKRRKRIFSHVYQIVFMLFDYDRPTIGE
ncbi:unnamed protein product, partial [Callosobruchus maculatus]